MKLCDLETAKALQELGYDGEYQTVHYLDKNLKEKVPVHRLDDANYFLREKYGIYAYVELDKNEDGVTCFDTYIADMSNGKMQYQNSFSSYDIALEYGVKGVIRAIKNKQQ